uniref:Putative serine protease n=1 Tax=Ixodes ricinus TaxID=34613 RepID=A0A147BTZ3_IXORI
MFVERLILMSLLVNRLSAFPQVSTEKCGLPAKQPDHSNTSVSERILNGKEAIPGAWPWQVEIRVQGRHACGGVLIGPQHVLTSAHCIPEHSAKSLKIRLGSYSSDVRDKTALEATTDTICIHPAFNKSGDENDIAIIKLNNSIECSENIRIVCLPEKDGEPNYSDPTYMAGWGYTEPLRYNEKYFSGTPERTPVKDDGNLQEKSDSRIESQEKNKDESYSEEYFDYSNVPAPVSKVLNIHPAKLQQSQVQIISNDECAKLSERSFVSKNFVCANHEFGSICSGDSGGPLVYKGSDGRWTLMGLVTATVLPCNVTNHPMFFVKITPFMKDFIIPCIQNSRCYCKPLK